MIDSYLHLRPEAEEKYQLLIREANKPGVFPPCQGDPDKWDGYDQDGVPIPTNEEAMQMCAGCPVLDICRDFARTEKPAIGIYGGEVWGRGAIIAERKGLLR